MATNEEKDTSITKVDEEVENPLSDMPPKMQRFIHLYMTGQYSLNKLAQLLEVHPNTLTNWLKREDVRLAITEMQVTTHEIVGQQLKALTSKAVQKLHSLVDSPIDGVALQAVKDILDRSGHKSKQEIKIDKTVRTFEEKMNDLIEATVIDAEYEEVEDE